MKEQNLKKDIGLVIATALVAGNMMGSGIFMLPASLSQISGPGSIILAWLITGIGSIFLALSFASLGSKFPKTGGPYEYSKVTFGKFPGFLSAWLYWNGSWIGNSAVIIAVASYTGKLIPSISENHMYSFLYASLILWLFTIINILGVRMAGKIQTTITIFEVCLFVFFIISAAIHFKMGNLQPLFPTGKGLSTMPKAATSTLWAFVGLESATIAAGEIKNPEKNVARSTILGIVIATVLYMAINVFAMGAMPQSKLSQSGAPIADILAQYFGSGIINFITVAVVISILGTTVGWLLSTARVAFAAAEDNLFPSVFGKVHPKYKTPHMALIIGSILVNILLLLNYNKSLKDAFDFIILLATLSFLPIYAMTAVADLKQMLNGNKNLSVLSLIKKSIIPALGFVYAIWTIYGSGFEVILYGCILIIAGVPVYFFIRRKSIQLTMEN